MSVTRDIRDKEAPKDNNNKIPDPFDSEYNVYSANIRIKDGNKEIEG